MASDKTPSEFQVCKPPRLAGMHPSAEVNFALPIDISLVALQHLKDISNNL
jgi:hypothetical protein